MTVYTPEELESVQIWLPYSDYARSARSLDKTRLGRQRIEGLQLLSSLTGRTSGWFDTTEARAWAGHETSLLICILASCDEWTSRGYVDHVAERCQDLACHLDPLDRAAPSWLGNKALHLAHRRRLIVDELLRGESEWYVAQWPHTARTIIDKRTITQEGDLENVRPVYPWPSRVRQSDRVPG